MKFLSEFERPTLLTRDRHAYFLRSVALLVKVRGVPNFLAITLTLATRPQAIGNETRDTSFGVYRDGTSGAITALM